LAEAVGLETAIKSADVVFTGEGSYDAQTAQGKVVSLVEQLAAKHGKPSIVVCGVNKTDRMERIFDLVGLFPVAKCMGQTAECLSELVRIQGPAILAACQTASL